jgi:hypothetical protein
LLGFPLLIVFSKSPENEAVFYLCAYVDTWPEETAFNDYPSTSPIEYIGTFNRIENIIEKMRSFVKAL